MPVVTFAEAAAALGYASAGPLHRMRREGKLQRFLRSRDGHHALELDGLAGYLAGVLKADHRRPAAVQGGDSGDGGGLLEARERVERLRGDLLALELAERAGRVVAVAELKPALFGAFRRCRDALQVMPEKVADAVAAAADRGDREAVRRIMHKEIREILANLAADPAGKYLDDTIDGQVRDTGGNEPDSNACDPDLPAG